MCLEFCSLAHVLVQSIEKTIQKICKYKNNIVTILENSIEKKN